jgi:transposase
VQLAQQVRVVRGRTLPAFPSTRTIALELKRRRMPCVHTTVGRVLQQHGLRAYVRPKAPTLDEAKFAKRLEFCRFWTKQPKARIRRLVFSDEHWVTTNDHTTRTQWARSKNATVPRESKNPFNIPSFMIWGAIGVGWRSPLVFIKKRGPRSGEPDDGPRGMNAEKYVRVCLSKIVPTLVERRLIFQQDGARAHMASSTTDYLRRKGVETVEDWPPYSPDLNPIEQLWKILNERLSAFAPNTFSALQAATIEAWNAIPQSMIDNLVISFAAKVAACHAAKGGVFST